HPKARDSMGSNHAIVLCPPWARAGGPRRRLIEVDCRGSFRMVRGRFHDRRHRPRLRFRSTMSNRDGGDCVTIYGYNAMPATPVVTADSAIDRIFGPVIQAQTWINVLYLVASFPLGLLYFVALSVVLSAGVGLVPIFVGLFILWAGLKVVEAFAELDRLALNTMLRAGIPPRAPAPAASGNIFDRMLAALHRPGTLRRL